MLLEFYIGGFLLKPVYMRMCQLWATWGNISGEPHVGASRKQAANIYRIVKYIEQKRNMFRVRQEFTARLPVWLVIVGSNPTGGMDVCLL
jgi:hypothetical protein